MLVSGRYAHGTPAAPPRSSSPVRTTAVPRLLVSPSPTPPIASFPLLGLLLAVFLLAGLAGCSGGDADEVERGPTVGTGPALSTQQPMFQDVSERACCPQDCTTCRICIVGKPCGNTCITVTDICHQPQGCACQR